MHIKKHVDVDFFRGNICKGQIFLYLPEKGTKIPPHLTNAEVFFITHRLGANLLVCFVGFCLFKGTLPERGNLHQGCIKRFGRQVGLGDDTSLVAVYRIDAVVQYLGN